MLKKSLAKIPVWGWGMKNFRFFFLSRAWKKDEKVLTEGLERINEEGLMEREWSGKKIHSQDSHESESLLENQQESQHEFENEDGSQSQNPAWLILFPEGTTASALAVSKTKQFASSHNPPLTIPSNVLIPRARGLRFTLSKLSQTVTHVYDATFYYHGIPSSPPFSNGFCSNGGTSSNSEPGNNTIFGEDYFSLKRMFLKGDYPKIIDVHWRKYKICDIPWTDELMFEKWLQARWVEKDRLVQSVKENGRFASVEAVEPKHYTYKYRGNNRESSEWLNNGVNGENGGVDRDEFYRVEEGPDVVGNEVVVPVKLESLWELGKIYFVPAVLALVVKGGLTALKHY